MSGCSAANEEELDSANVGEVEAPLEGTFFVAKSMDATAVHALTVAGPLTDISQDDPTNPVFPEQIEYCGLIVKRAGNGGFRAGFPYNDILNSKKNPRDPNTTPTMHCDASIKLASGERIVGFYHTHTPASIPGFSPGDIREAFERKRTYYVLSVVDGCTRRYEPSTKRTTLLGCSKSR